MPAWLLPAAMTAASLGGSILENKAQKKAVEQAEAQRQANMGLITDYGQRAVESILPGYQAAQNVRQQAMDQNLALAGSTFRPMIESVQAGDFMGQQALLAGLMGQRNAILGDPINYGALSAQSVPVNYGALSGLTSPQGLNFAPMQMPEYSKGAQMEWDARSAQDYLSANPDIRADYQANKAALIAGGDPQFRTEEGYAKWHYDNYGKAENRPLKLEAPNTQPGTQGEAFSYDQVYKALNQMMG